MQTRLRRLHPDASVETYLMSLRKAVGREMDVFGDVLTDCRCGKGFFITVSKLLKLKEMVQPWGRAKINHIIM